MLSEGISKFHIPNIAWYQSTDDQAMADRAKFAEGDMIKSDIQELTMHQSTSQLINQSTNQPIN